MCPAIRQETERGEQFLWFATCPEEQTELESFEKRGVLVRIGSFENPADHQEYPVYREERSLMETMCDDLVAEGFLVKTGKTRVGHDGRPHAVYVAREYASKVPLDDN